MTLDLTIALAPALFTTPDPDRGVYPAIASAVTAAVARIAEPLRLPSTATVSVIERGPAAGPRDHGLTIRVNGSRLWPDDTLPMLVHQRVAGAVPERWEPFHVLLAALDDQSLAVRFAAECVEDALRQRPGAMWSGGPVPPDPVPGAGADGTEALMRSLLDLGLPVPGADDLAVWQSGRADRAELYEQLVEQLAAPSVAIEIGAEHLRELTLSSEPSLTGLLPFLRDGLYEEIGLLFPPFRLAPDPARTDRRFAFRMNAVSSGDYLGLAPDQCLVAEHPEQLRARGFTAARAWLNPATRQIASVLPLTDRPAIDAAGITSWTPFGYLVLCFAESLRRCAARFVTTTFVRRCLDHLGRAYPADVAAASSYLSAAALSHTLRELVEDAVPIRNFTRIVQRIAECEYALFSAVRVASIDSVVSERRPDGSLDWVAFLRRGLAREISAKHTRGGPTLTISLLDPILEQQLLQSAPGPVPDADATVVMEAFLHHVAGIQPPYAIPAILTSAAVRPRVRAVLRDAFPKVPVLSYDDLDPELLVQPVARIEAVAAAEG